MNISDLLTQQFLLQSVANNPILRDNVGTNLLDVNHSFFEVLSTILTEMEQDISTGSPQKSFTPPTNDNSITSNSFPLSVGKIGTNPTVSSNLDSKLGGVLKGQGAVFEQAGKMYGIDPKLLAAISMHETGNGTSNAVRNKNNVGGMMGEQGLQSFKSLEDGILAMASNLKRNYFDKGLNTISEIQKKYAPIGAENDPTDLNQYWASAVSKYYKQMNT
jgi:hypothetical protein